MVKEPSCPAAKKSEQGPHHHICLCDFPDHPEGGGLANNDEHILKVLYQEALSAERADQRPWGDWVADRIERWSSEGFDAFCYPRAGLTPANLHVYAHTPPERGREAFLQLDVDFYQHPPSVKDAKPLDCAPAYIRNLRYVKALPACRATGGRWRLNLL